MARTHLSADERLLDACISGDEAAARAALAAGASVHCVAVRAGSDALPDGSVAFREQLQCPLHLAAEHNQLGVAALLLASGADVNFLACGVVGDGEGDAEQQCDTPLMCAAYYAHVPMLELLLSRGADVAATTPKGECALQFAACSPRVAEAPAAVALLLAHGAPTEQASSCSGTPLTIAAAWGRAEVVRLLLAAGADPCALSAGCDATPLIAAARAPAADPVRARSAEVVRALLSAQPRVKVNATNAAGETALLAAARVGSGEQLAVVQALLDAGADARYADGEGATALHAAAELGNATLLRTLLQAGAEVHACNEAGETALHFAACSGCVDALTALLQAGAEAGAKRNDGTTPLMLAASSGDAEAAGALLAAGAPVDDADCDGRSALIVACECSAADVAALLLSRGASPRARLGAASAGGCAGWTALHYAAARGDVALVEVLAGGGACVAALTDRRSSPLDLAVGGGHAAAAALLRRLGGASGAPAEAETYAPRPALSLSGRDNGTRPDTADDAAAEPSAHEPAAAAAKCCMLQ